MRLFGSRERIASITSSSWLNKKFCTSRFVSFFLGSQGFLNRYRLLFLQGAKYFICSVNNGQRVLQVLQHVYRTNFLQLLLLFFQKIIFFCFRTSRQRSCKVNVSILLAHDSGLQECFALYLIQDIFRNSPGKKARLRSSTAPYFIHYN